MSDPTDPRAPAPEREVLAQAFARCFGDADGAVVLAHLRRLTQTRALGPEAADATLRHLEGQRQLVGQIEALIVQGRNGV
jgi:hypothetical protein